MRRVNTMRFLTFQRTGILLCVILAGALMIFQSADASGTVSIRLVNYTNPTGQVKLSQGGVACCDQRQGGGRSCDIDLCDPQIVMCITPVTRKRFCDLFNVTTSPYRNTASLAFLTRPFEDPLGQGPDGEDIDYIAGSTAISSRFQYWDGSIFIKIKVLEVDQRISYDMTDISVPYTVSTPSLYGDAQWKTLEFRGEGITIALEVSVQCDKGFRDMFCSCEDRNTTQEHTMCTRERERVCLPGWAEPPGRATEIKCLQSTLPCHPDNNKCLNNATCETYNDGAQDVIVCVCLQDYTGQYCDTYITTTTTTTTTTATTPPTPAIVTGQGATTATPINTTTAATLINATTNPPPVNTTIIATPINTTLTTTTTTTTTTNITTTKITTSSRPAAAVSTSAPRQPTTVTTTPTKAVPQSTKSPLVATSPTSQVGQTTNPISVTSEAIGTTTAGAGSNGSQPMGRNSGAVGKGSQGQSSEGGGGGSDSTPVIAGAAGGIVAALALAALLLALFRKRLFKKKQPSVSDVERESVQQLEEDEPEAESPEREEDPSAATEQAS